MLRRFGIGKKVRVEMADAHNDKIGTPTMGGLLILLPVLVVTVGLNIVNLIGPNVTITGRSILLPLAGDGLLRRARRD